MARVQINIVIMEISLDSLTENKKYQVIMYYTPENIYTWRTSYPTTELFAHTCYLRLCLQLQENGINLHVHQQMNG